MATKKQTEQTTTIVEQNPTDLAEKIAARRALDEEIRAMKASAPKLNPLEKVIQRQATNFPGYLGKYFASRTLARIAAGQPADVALTEVLAFFAGKATELIEEALSRDADADAKMDTGK